VLGEPKERTSLWRDLLGGVAVIGSALFGVLVLYLVTGLLLAVHFTS